MLLAFTFDIGTNLSVALIFAIIVYGSTHTKDKEKEK